MKPAPELIVATAGSDTSASVVQKVFTPIAAEQGAPLKVTDVAPTAEDDPTGQGIFFLLVAISIGSYASVAVIGGAGAVLPLRLRAMLAVGTSFVVSIIGTVFAGPVFHLVDHGLWGLWGMAWLYSAGILLIGTGLHTFLKRWTTLGVMTLFVMLNFTSSGGIFRPEMQHGFFAALHSFWNGAGFVEGVRSHVYFAGHGLAGHLVTLACWLAVGLLVVGVAAAAERRRRTAERSAVANAAAVAAAAVAATVPERATASGGRRLVFGRRLLTGGRASTLEGWRRRWKRRWRRRWKRRWGCSRTGVCGASVGRLSGVGLGRTPACVGGVWVGGGWRWGCSGGLGAGGGGVIWGWGCGLGGFWEAVSGVPFLGGERAYPPSRTSVQRVIHRPEPGGGSLDNVMVGRSRNRPAGRTDGVREGGGGSR